MSGPAQPGIDPASTELDAAILLEQRALAAPAAPFLWVDGERASYGGFNELANRVAAGLASHGVTPGEQVAVMLPNCMAFAATWFALMKLGAVEAPLNTEFKGAGLAHLLMLVAPRIMVLDAAYVDAVADVATAASGLECVFVRGDLRRARQRLPGVEVLAWDALVAAAGDNPARHTAAGDVCMLLFTSGTTGRSKACMLPHRYFSRGAAVFADHLGFTGEDILYCPYPLFHADATLLTIMPALLLGGQAAIGRRFSVSRFWEEIRTTGATVFDFMGATLTFLWKQPPRADDADNPARLAWGVPLPEFVEAFEQRFGLRVTTGYGSTDAGICVWETPGEPRRRREHGSQVFVSCGRALPAYDVRVVDSEDREVAAGQVGEIVIRPLEPGLITSGYYGMPEATLATFRNLWLHSGDLGIRDEDGYLYFVTRAKEAIRRRGENISAFEVEEVISAHPDVAEAAAFGVPSQDTEEEVAVVAVLNPQAGLTEAGLVSYCQPRMAGFMLPRWIRLSRSALPRTPTGKVEKFRLLETFDPATWWDREQQPASTSHSTGA